MRKPICISHPHSRAAPLLSQCQLQMEPEEGSRLLAQDTFPSSLGAKAGIITGLL